MSLAIAALFSAILGAFLYESFLYASEISLVVKNENQKANEAISSLLVWYEMECVSEDSLEIISELETFLEKLSKLEFISEKELTKTFPVENSAKAIESLLEWYNRKFESDTVVTKNGSCWNVRLYSGKFTTNQVYSTWVDFVKAYDSGYCLKMAKAVKKSGKAYNFTEV